MKKCIAMVSFYFRPFLSQSVSKLACFAIPIESWTMTTKPIVIFTLFASLTSLRGSYGRTETMFGIGQGCGSKVEVKTSPANSHSVLDDCQMRTTVSKDLARKEGKLPYSSYAYTHTSYHNQHLFIFNIILIIPQICRNQHLLVLWPRRSCLRSLGTLWGSLQQPTPWPTRSAMCAEPMRRPRIIGRGTEPPGSSSISGARGWSRRHWCGTLTTGPRWMSKGRLAFY